MDKTITLAKDSSPEEPFGTTNISGLKQKSIRGGAITVLAQGLKFGLQTGSTVILARLISPQDFGLQGMVVAMMGFLGLFRDAGLSVATIQRDAITHEQTSTLFWINVGVGALLAALAAATAPALVTFYKEPRLFWVTIVSATAFLFNSLAVQHQALLYRRMRFVTIAKIEVLSLAFSSTVGVGMAALGCGYWALVGMAVSNPMVSAAGVWLAMPWVPGKPIRGCGVRSMLHFGGKITLNSLVVYLAYNVEKILLGRFWGAEALGLYGRAYQVANLPVQQLNSSLAGVAFPALSRIQGDPERLRTLFLKGYSVVLSATMPVAFSCALFAEEIVLLLLGPKWSEANAVLRLLAPTVLAFALINPFGWFLQATARAGQSLHLAFLIAVVVIIGIVVGLPHGPKGVALGYSVAMTVVVFPFVVWAMHGTGMTIRDYWNSIRKPLLSGLLAGVTGLVFKLAVRDALTPIPLLLLGLTLCLGIYAYILLVIMGQSALYRDLLVQVLKRANTN